MNRTSVLQIIEKEKLIVILRNIPEDFTEAAVDALYEGGVRAFEMAFSADGRQTDDEILGRIRTLKKNYGERMAIGVGTVLSPEQVEKAADAGAEFVVSPDVNVEVIEKSVQKGLVSAPGAFTPTEAMTAHRAGADYIKVFPNGGMSPEYLAAMSTPLSHLKFLAVGGVTEKNAVSFFEAGACGIGVSTGIISGSILGKRDFDEIRRRAANFVKLIKQFSAQK